MTEMADRLRRAHTMQCCDPEIDGEISGLLSEIERLDAALHFLSNSETERRLRLREPEHARRAEIEKIEAAAIARHLARDPQQRTQTPEIKL